jgi:hypothetical protein
MATTSHAVTRFTWNLTGSLSAQRISMSHQLCPAGSQQRHQWQPPETSLETPQWRQTASATAATWAACALPGADGCQAECVTDVVNLTTVAGRAHDVPPEADTRTVIHGLVI